MEIKTKRPETIKMAAFKELEFQVAKTRLSVEQLEKSCLKIREIMSKQYMKRANQEQWTEAEEALKIVWSKWGKGRKMAWIYLAFVYNLHLLRQKSLENHRQRQPPWLRIPDSRKEYYKKEEINARFSWQWYSFVHKWLIISNDLKTNPKPVLRQLTLIVCDRRDADT